ncbi:O-antigen ligase like membrane family protein [Synechococcus sp. Minos11]|uniref:hypothetical protein n=1 Tax=Synechococcus sp. Minos11 TaxID=221341 RepID=UPI001646958C|nr:hypothetical protein [Synechococcus sp. Minos11]QNJ07664.1 O-antigen ligase like membrane family protein [Synechococcus sp. Minos11]
MVLLDLLLPVAAMLFLLPLNPLLSSPPVVAWVMAQLFFAPAERRWAAWPLLFVLLLFSRSWWLNQMPHPVAVQDGVLLVGALLAAACVSPQRWQVLLRLPLLVLPVLLLQMGTKPWTPNPFAGANQGGYLLGLIWLLAIAWFCQAKQPQWQRLLAGVATTLAAVMVWQTGSRAAFVAAVVSAALLWIQQGVGFGQICKRSLLVLAFGVAAGGAKQLLRPSSTGIPGIDLSSDSGRLAIAECYGAIPFSGNNRFLYGIGFDRSGEFCSDPIHGGVADHAHNIYLQIFASTGVLGVLGLVLLLVLLVLAWRSAAAEIDLFPRTAGQLVLLYTFIQGFLDLSLLHWPVTVVLSGVLLGIPLSWHSVYAERGKMSLVSRSEN